MFARAKNNQLLVLGGTSMALIPGAGGLDDIAFLVGTEGGVVQRCLVSKPTDKDVRALLSTCPEVAWTEEAMGFMGNIADPRPLQRIKDQVD